MKIRRQLNAVFVCVSVVASTVPSIGHGAFAQSAGACSCLAAMQARGSAVGRLTQIRGDVRMSQAGGYAGLKSEAPVYAGARIMTGARSSASLSVGANCTLEIPANVAVKVDPTEGGMCVSMDVPPQAKIVPVHSGPGLAPILLGGGAVGGAAALILSLHDDDNAVSR